jgi:hypothetical protein
VIIDIEDGTIDVLASRADVLAAFPTLFHGVVQARKALTAATCANCLAGLRKQLNNQRAGVKRTILTLSPENLAKFKVLLGADKVRVLSGTNHQGIPVRHTL